MNLSIVVTARQIVDQAAVGGGVSARGSMTQHNSLSIPRPAKGDERLVMSCRPPTVITSGCATRASESRYGQDFIVMMAPLLEQEREVEQLELAARIADVLDLVSPQFYNYGTVDPSWIVDRTLAWGRVVGEERSYGRG
jgi:hypothetical protein